MNNKLLFYIIKRLILAVITIFFVITITFFAMQLIPGGPFTSEKAVSEATLNILKAKYGLDKPLFVQYINYLKRAFVFDFGYSIKNRGAVSVNEIILNGLKISAPMGLIAALIAIFVGVILGLLISINTEFVFNAASQFLYWSQYFFTSIFNPKNLMFVQENSTYGVYANIPARIFFPEVVMIALFGVIAPLFASWAASKNVLKMTVAEVLHHE